MGLQLEQYIPLPQAAKRLKISAASLQGLIDSGNNALRDLVRVLKPGG